MVYETLAIAALISLRCKSLHFNTVKEETIHCSLTAHLPSS